jgi:methionine-rich copper-binding protein CopC
MNRSLSVAVLFATLLVSQPIWAHTDESLDAMPSPHGGQVRAAGPYHLELVAKEGQLVLHVTDHANNEINTTGAEGKANIQQGKAGSKIQIKLEPSQSNMMAGSGEFLLNPETVIVVFVKLPEQDPYAARFTPLKPKSVGAGKKVGRGHGHDQGHDDQHKQH